MNVDDYIREWYCKHHLDTREIAQKMLDDLGISRSKSWVLSRVHALGIVRDRSQANKIKWTKTPCHKRIDIPPEDLNKAIELYNEGHGTPYIKSNLNLKCSHQVLQKNLARAGCQLRNSKDAAKASPNLTRPVIKLQDDTQFRLIRSYEMGESYYALAQVYGHAPDTIKRILIENDVRIRTHAEACSLRSAQKRSEREAKELESLKPLISKNYNLIRKSIRSFVRTSQRKLFLNRDVEDVGIIQDITCDSDGRIDQYVDNHDLATSLPLPEQSKQDFSLAVFMVGAYQEILGDMHNLFGDTDAVDVLLDGAGGFDIVKARKGDTVDHILRYVQYDTMLLQQQIHEQLLATDLDTQQQAHFLKELREGLTGYTYLE